MLFYAAMPSLLETSAASFAQSADPRLLWNEIVRWTFEACILRKEGRERRVAELLQERLPALIRAWSQRCGLDAETCKQQLRGLFSRAQENVEFGFIQRRLIVEEICQRLASVSAPAAAALKAEASGPVGLRRRVPIGDISQMLDALAEAEFETMGEAVLPLRRTVAPAPEDFAGEPAAQVALCA